MQRRGPEIVCGAGRQRKESSKPIKLNGATANVLAIHNARDLLFAGSAKEGFIL